MPVWVTDLFIFFWSLYCSSPTPYNGQKYLPDPLNHQGQDDPEDNWLKRPLKSSPFTFMTNKILCNANFAIKLSAGFWKMGITVSTIQHIYCHLVQVGCGWSIQKDPCIIQLEMKMCVQIWLKFITLIRKNMKYWYLDAICANQTIYEINLENMRLQIKIKIRL